MNWFPSILIGLAVGYWLGFRQGRAKASTEEPRQEKVLALFDGQKELTNDDVQKALGVSDATATRVLDELEKSGHLMQIGNTGRGVVYRRK